MKFRLLIFLYLSVSIFSSCNKKDNSEFTDTPIIEAYLRPGEPLDIKVSRQIPFSSDVTYSSDDIDGLVINIINNNKEYTLTPIGEGEYINSSLIVKEGESYTLSFVYNSRNVSAYTKVPEKPANFVESAGSIYVSKMDSTSGPSMGGGFGSMPEPVTLEWDNTDDSYFIVVIENMETSPESIRDFGSDAPPANRFKKAPTTSSGLQLRPQEFQYFGKHRLILYHVLPDYASLYSDNSNSSQNLTNPSTSIINGYGIFTGLSADTLYFTVYKN
jgi:hypothetical protein